MSLNYFLLYIWMGFTTFLNMFFIVSGSAIVNPVTAILTDPHRAIGIGSFVFFVGSIHRVFLFRKEIFIEKQNKQIIKMMLPFSIVGAFLGSSFITKINTLFLSYIVVLTSIYFIYSTIKYIFYKKTIVANRKSYLGPILVAFLTGFFQGASLPGADMRTNYLRTQVTEISVRGISSFLALFNFLILSSVLFFNHKLLKADLFFVLYFIPGLFIIQYIGKKILIKIPDMYAKSIALCMSIVSLSLFIYSVWF